MKVRNLAFLAALPAAILAANAAIADEGPTVYGKIDLSLEQDKLSSATYLGGPFGPSPQSDQWNLNSNQSRIGVKGSNDIGAGNKAVYKIEFEFSADNGDIASTTGQNNGSTNVMRQRNTYLGVEGNWGTVIGGHYDTPLRASQGKVDQFADSRLGDIANIMPGENRLSNQIMYSSPKIAQNITVNVAVAPGEGNTTSKYIPPSLNPPTNNDTGIADYKSMSVVYDTEALYLAAAYNHNVPDINIEPYNTGTGFSTDILRLTGQVKLDNLVLGALVQKAKATDSGGFFEPFYANAVTPRMDDYATSGLVSAAYSIGKNTLKAQLGETLGRHMSDAGNNIITTFSLGLDHNFTRSTKVYVFYTEISEDDNAVGQVNANTEMRALGVGFAHKFQM